METIHISSIDEIKAVAQKTVTTANGKKVFCFYGEMGAGKTTLIKEICKQVGVSDEGSSPTFSIVNEYKILSPPSKCYHFDLYRLKSESEFFDIGYEDYIFSGNYCFIEWPEKVEHLLPTDIIRIHISSSSSGSEERTILIS